jgi:hypothetical protein
MDNHGSADADGNKKKAPAGAAQPTSDLSEANINQDDFAQELSSDLPSMAVSSAFPDSPPFAASQSPPLTSKVNQNGGRAGVCHGTVSDMKKLEHAPLGEPPNASLPSASTPNNADIDRGVAHGCIIGTNLLEHAPPSETLPSPGLRILKRHPVVSASNQDVTPGAFPVRSRNTLTSRSFRSPVSSYVSTREVIHDESKHEDDVSNTAAESCFYTVEAQEVKDGNEEETMIFAEAEYVRMKWFQRPVYRWILFGSILFACGLVVTVVVLVVRPSMVSSTSWRPTSLLPEAIACNFLSISNVTYCQSIFKFSTKTTGSTIPSEIGVLTQLTFLDFSDQSLTSAIPSEIGLLTQLTVLDFYDNSLTSTIPSEIGLLTQLTSLNFYENTLTSTIPSEIGVLKYLTYLYFGGNSLTSTIPSEIGLLTQLKELLFDNNFLTSTIPSAIGLLTLLESLSFSNNAMKGTIPSSLCSLSSLYTIYINCGEITCASGCCTCE